MLNDYVWVGVIAAVLGHPLMYAVGKILFHWAVSSQPEVKAAATGFADYHEAVMTAVAKAEGLGMHGPEKLTYALKLMERWLDEHGIEGNARAITLERIRADIELARAGLFPSK